MKKLTAILISVLFACSIMYSQTIPFHEDFETVPDSVTAIGNWAVSKRLAAGGQQSDSCKVALSDTAYLITDSFSTKGNTFVLLEFAHICKIEFFDAAEIEVSVNNGATWTKLTSAEYLGTAMFGIFGNRFCANSYMTDWRGDSNHIQPANTWWKVERFDISFIAGDTLQVRIRFSLRDGNGNGSYNNYGWLLDNIKVIMDSTELTPPVITLDAPVYKDSVYSRGPYNIFATITDKSGIDTTYLIYTHNWGTPDTVGMINTSGNSFFGTIDTLSVSFQVGDTICYYVSAIDASPAGNKSEEPGVGCNSFVIKAPSIPPNCNTIVKTFPFIENFDAFPTGGTSCGSVCQTANNWVNETTDDVDWAAISLSTYTADTGPDNDHTSGNGRYMYVEASNCSNKTAVLTTPCIDLTVLTTPFLEFWYHMYGADMGQLHVDIYYGGKWVNDIITPLAGNKGDKWQKADVNLSYYKGITKIRFRGITGNGEKSDMAIDDVKIWIPPANDAGIVSVDKPVSPSMGGNQDVKVTLKNYGSVNLTNVEINWNVNGVKQDSFPWTGILSPGTTVDSILIGNFNFSTGGVYMIKVWTERPNGATDGFKNNDTAQAPVIVCSGALKGTFNIGGITPHFLTFSDALYALNYCSIDSHVVFNVASGGYNEQLLIKPIHGASGTNTVTFQSATGDSSDVVLSYAATVAADNYVIKLDSADYITFKGITIRAKGDISGSYARAVVLDNKACNNTFANNIIDGIVMNKTSDELAVVYLSGSLDNNNKFLNNNIHNGDYGIYIKGVSATSLASGNIIEGNAINNYLRYGVYAYYQDSIQIKRNTIESTSSYYYGYGIYADYCDNGMRIEKNKINVHTGANNYGILIENCDGKSSEPAIIANNFVSQTDVSANNVWGINCTDSRFQYFYNNNVNVIGTTSGGTAFYLTGGAYIRLKNNILANNGGGFAINVATPAAITSDFNNFYATGTNLGFYNSNLIADIIAWQFTTMKDANSKSVNPYFPSNTDLHCYNSSLGEAGTPLSEVTDDIDGDVRNSLTPDIGADEFLPPQKDVGAIAIIQPQNAEDEGASVPVKVIIKNFGTDTITSMNIAYQLNSNTPVSYSWSGNLLYKNIDTVTLPNIIIPFGLSKIFVYTLLNGDAINLNDTSCISFYGIPSLVIFEDDFEGTNYWTVDSPSLWQHGIPTANTINSAFSPINVWATNLSGNYTQNAEDFLYSPVFDFSNITGSVLKFWHWVDCEPNGDGGNLQYTPNGGFTWINLGVRDDTNGVNWYNTFLNGRPLWTGFDSKWQLSLYDLSQFDNYPTPLQFRFGFYSDASGNNYNGWAIDDFSITMPKSAEDAGIIAIVEPTIPDSGNSIQVKVTIKNFGLNTLTSIPVKYKVGNNSPIQETWTGSLLSDATTDYTFATKFISPDAYILCTYTQLINDKHTFNDSICNNMGNVGMQEKTNEIFRLEQNIPNPADDKTIIPFTTSETGKVTCKVFNIIGQTVYTGNKQIIGGKHQFEINVKKMPQGLYYYSIEFKGKCLVKKMVIH